LSIGLCGCGQSGEEPRISSSGFSDETQFIVHSVVAELAAMADYAHLGSSFAAPDVRVREKAGSPVGRPIYAIQLSGRNSLRFELTVDRAIWDPTLYADLTSRLFRQPVQSDRKTAVSGDVSSTLLMELAGYDVESIESANRAVSEQLTRTFLDPVGHERAALVLGVFGLREASGDFYDVRPVLCRMTAHLAVARRLAGVAPQTSEGLVADAIRLTLMGNQTDALIALDKLGIGDEVKPWRRALRARITGDYRELDGAADISTVLERVCLFEALCRSLDRSDAWQKVPAHELRSRTDYCRWVNSHPRSVELGHALRELSLPLEMIEIAEVLRQVRASDSDKEPDWSILNAEPTTCVALGDNRSPTVHVIGWGDWAMFLQRHLGHGVQQQFHFLMRSWSVPEVAAQFAREADSRFGKMRLYPFVQLANATSDASFRTAAMRCAVLVGESPERFGPALWNRFHQPPRGVAPAEASGLWGISEWHKHNPPPFTGYMIRPRLNHMSFIHGPQARSLITALHERSPFDPEAARALLHVRHGREGFNAPIEDLESVYGPLLEYSVPQMVRVALFATNHPAFYERYMERAATLRPNHYFDLADYVAGRKESAKAAGYYEKAVANCRDEVVVANHSRWLVQYYFDQQRVADAESLADRAAATYSYAGLKTKGDLLYWQRRYEESMDYYRKLDERYDAPYAVVLWWADYRGGTNDTRFDAEIEKRMKSLFPRGVETVTLTDLTGRPDEGVVILTENDLIRETGLKKGDIIVALNGRRVYDMPQYVYVRCQLREPTMHLICWDGQQYVEHVASPPDHRFGVRFRSFSTR
jgi:hypothetical protein